MHSCCKVVMYIFGLIIYVQSYSKYQFAVKSTYVEQTTSRIRILNILEWTPCTTQVASLGGCTLEVQLYCMNGMPVIILKFNIRQLALFCLLSF